MFTVTSGTVTSSYSYSSPLKSCSIFTAGSVNESSSSLARTLTVLADQFDRVKVSRDGLTLKSGFAGLRFRSTVTVPAGRKSNSTV